MLTLDRVSFAYGDHPVLTDVSLTIPHNGTICLFGASGSGKTTLLRLIAGLEEPTSGHIFRRNALEVVYVFQENRLIPWLTVRENVAFVLRTPDDTLVNECLRAVELDADADRYPDELSGGMQRRVALARAMAYGGDLLLLDEPFNGLDDELKKRIASALRQRFHDKAIVLVTHSQEEAALFGATLISL